MVDSSKGRLCSLDFMKFVAAIFITNSHFQPLYKGINTAFATFGVHGNALFFFVAGFLLMKGFDKHKGLNVVDWYKARIRRLWPSVFLWAIVAAAIWKAPLTIPRLVFMDGYWFLQAIAVAYLLFYIFSKPLKRFGGGNKQLQYVFLLSLVVSVVFFFFMPVAESSPFHTNFHYVCHFSIMVMGGLCYIQRDKLNCNRLWKDCLVMFLSFVLYFVILKIGKGQNGIRYYTQILALLPLHTFVYYCYKTCSYSWCQSIFQIRILGRIITVIAVLTLEIYVVQFSVITDYFNYLFPLNIFIVFILITFAAYLLKILTSLFLAVLSKEHLEWKDIVKV